MSPGREECFMSTTITGVVTNGVVVPNSPLPEGAQVEIRLPSVQPEVPPELQEEFDDWDRAGAGAVEMVERLAEEMEADEKR
jgi:hypothetical protein